MASDLRFPANFFTFGLQCPWTGLISKATERSKVLARKFAMPVVPAPQSTHRVLRADNPEIQDNKSQGVSGSPSIFTSSTGLPSYRLRLHAYGERDPGSGIGLRERVRNRPNRLCAFHP